MSKANVNEVMKTIEEWINQIDNEVIKKQALNNYKYRRLHPTSEKFNSFSDAIDHAFTWSETKEGFDFWYVVGKNF